MNLIGREDDTICALSTAPGVGGIAVLRICGKNVMPVARKLFSRFPQKPESHRVYFTPVLDPDQGTLIDEALVTYFGEGRSYTGDETVEISCHGGLVVPEMILQALIAQGCRLAEPGEFTFRAFSNGRLDLVQAESVLDLIESQSTAAAQVAVRQLRGHLSEQFHKIEDGLVWMLAQLEASIDFSTEDIDVVDMTALNERALDVLHRVDKLIKGYRHGEILREGVRIMLLGETNVGKSSLLNALVGEERAIVTDVPGTTRDVVEAGLVIGGRPVRILDTAGVRETGDQIEKIGIERTHQEMARADLVLFVLDLTRPDLNNASFDIIRGVDKPVMIVANKLDLISPAELAHREEQFRAVASESRNFQWLTTSVKTGQGIETLRKSLEDWVASELTTSAAVAVNQRHFELLGRVDRHVRRCLELSGAGESPEFVAFELREAVICIHEILGKEFHEQVIDRIFKEFCLGK